ncbi:hypothetical protein RF11_04631 [Thelohanellus kitauei]|uniref:Tc1-like transposase DDE domain-containing protein n=1 Tax=Thelohanellus kitauei TaxID=669202 RepID=A0A0C2NDI4_THEKT|nr:hypothetical protein RF11_04631 [Thelohanellus kitauei]
MSACESKKGGVLLERPQFQTSKIHHPYNKNTFKDYIGNLMNYLENRSVGPCVFIMYNFAFHKFDVIKQEVHMRGHQIEYLPPYSPFLNPIENMLSKWKNCQKI